MGLRSNTLTVPEGFSAEQIEAFCRLTGDRNVLHETGQEHPPVVPGLLQYFYASAHLLGDFISNGATHASGTFTQMLFADEPVVFSVSDPQEGNPPLERRLGTTINGEEREGSMDRIQGLSWIPYNGWREDSDILAVPFPDFFQGHEFLVGDIDRLSEVLGISRDLGTLLMPITRVSFAITQSFLNPKLCEKIPGEAAVPPPAQTSAEAYLAAKILAESPRFPAYMGFEVQLHSGLREYSPDQPVRINIMTTEVGDDRRYFETKVRCFQGDSPRGRPVEGSGAVTLYDGRFLLRPITPSMVKGTYRRRSRTRS